LATTDQNTEAMEHIWKQVAKNDENGTEYIHYTGIAELNFLYFTGFVDTRKHTLEQWQQAFLESRLPNGSYRINKDQWMIKRNFRYNGPVEVPFNPKEDLKDRVYTEQEILDILTNKIVPSTSVDEKTILGYMKHYKDRGLMVDGEMKVDANLKRDINGLLEMYPSPLRVLQQNVQKMREEQAGKISKVAEPHEIAATQSQFMAHQQQEKMAADRLSSLLKTGGSQKPASQPAEDQGQGLSLKDLQRGRARSRKI
jgi:hypothetical protein